MKSLLMTLALTLAAAAARAHGDIEIGPNKGRVLDLAKDRSLRAEVTVKDGAFHLALLDKQLKPAAKADGELTALTADRAAPKALKVEAQPGGYTVEKPEGAKYHVIFSYKPAPDAKPVVARLPYDESVCGGCKGPEWLCACH